MKTRDWVRSCASLALSAVIFATTLAGSAAQAEMISTSSAMTKYQALADRDRLLTEIRSEEIRSELIAMGIDPAEAEARLAAMTDAEIAARVQTLDNDPAGASDIVGALLTVFLILLVTDLLCLTRVFRFVRSC